MISEYLRILRFKFDFENVYKRNDCMKCRSEKFGKSEKHLGKQRYTWEKCAIHVSL